MCDTVRWDRFSRFRVFLLKNIEDIGLATAVADAGLLSTAENLGAFSTLEKLGAFSLAEKLLPLIESLKLLSFFEGLLEVEAGLTFSIAGFILATGPSIFVLQICGFLPTPQGPALIPELLFDAATFAAGAALFATAFLISKLQLAADADSATV